MRTLPLDLDSAVPLYRQIADGLRAQVARGELGPGEALPSVRRLGAALGVNLNTVAKAYRLLAQEGVVTLRPGARATVAEAPAAAPFDADQVAREVEALLARYAVAGLDRQRLEGVLAQVVDRLFPREVP